MDKALETFFQNQSGWLLIVEIAAILAVLAKAADWLVGEAVVLSERSGLPKVVIGATIVSLGTTAPEAAVSVLAALQGKPGLALGNAVGSIICDTGLILGVACLIRPLKLPPQIVNRQGWLQFGAGVLLVAMCWPWATGGNPLHEGGNLPQLAGFVFMGLLLGYLWLSVRWARSTTDGVVVQVEQYEKDAATPMSVVVVKLLFAIALVVGASHVLIPAITEAAYRMRVPPGIVAATLVAFGTSLPELVTAVTASLRGHGDLAVGNVIGADILNVLFVAGTAAAVTRGGLDAPPPFFWLQFPAMLLILITFRCGAFLSGDAMKRGFGLLLLALYAVYLVLNFTLLPAHKPDAPQKSLQQTLLPTQETRPGV